MRDITTRTFTALAAATVTSALLVAAPVRAADDEGAYGYFRTVEGSATVYGLDESYPVEVNRPLLTGDRVQTRFGDRIEAVLPDATRVRIGQDSEVLFDQLAYSADEWAETTLLYLDHGELTLTVPEERRTRATIRVDTPNATFYLDSSGTYSFEARGYVSQGIVRQGHAEVLTRKGEYRLRAGEHAWVEGMEWPQVELRRAGSRSELERWAYDLDLEADRYRDSEYVDGALAYSTSRLDRYGSWHRTEDRTFWRPTGVGQGWRPYDDGYWTHTPSGLTWVSHEPWGWSTYHYGTWDHHSRYGWVWYPGTRYAPAWVYWYWGPRYVGWCPIGYYTSYYHGYPYWDRGFRFGVHGWSRGHWGHFDRWNFVDVDHLADRRLARHTRSSRALRDSGADLGRGLVTTDTRPLDRDALRDPRRAVRVLRDAPAARTRSGSGRDLPDVTDWVARKREIPTEMKRIAMPVTEGASPEARGGTGSEGARRAVVPRDRRPPTREDAPDERRIRSRAPSEGLSAPPRATPKAGSSDSGSRSRAVPRSRSGSDDRPRSDSGARTRSPDRLQSHVAPEVPWRTRRPETRSEGDERRGRRVAPRSSSPARRVLEGVRSDRSRSPRTRGSSSSRSERDPGVTSRSRPRSRSSTRSSSPRRPETRSSPSSRRPSTRSSPSTKRSRSSTKSRSSGSRSRSRASSRSSGSSSRGSGSKSRQPRRRSDPDR